MQVIPRFCSAHGYGPVAEACERGECAGFISVSPADVAVMFDHMTYGRGALETCWGALAERREGIDQLTPSGEMIHLEGKRKSRLERSGMMTRRSFVLSAALFPLALSLDGCADDRWKGFSYKKTVYADGKAHFAISQVVSSLVEGNVLDRSGVTYKIVKEIDGSLTAFENMVGGYLDQAKKALTQGTEQGLEYGTGRAIEWAGEEGAASLGECKDILAGDDLSKLIGGEVNSWLIHRIAGASEAANENSARPERPCHLEMAA